MASALDDDEIGSDDYYSLLNVRREVRYTAVTRIDTCASVISSYCVSFFKLVFDCEAHNVT